MTATVTDGMVVSLSYILSVDGEELARSDENDPLEYLHGASNIVPGLEAALTGKQQGDKFSVTLEPDAAYGEYDEDEVDEVPLADMELIDGDALEKGMIVEVEDDEGYVHYATITNITDDTIVLDFNPPLAGKTLTYDVEVLKIREATPEERDHGHVHSAGHDHH